MIYIDGFNLIYRFPDTEELMIKNKLNRARSLLLEYIKIYEKIRKKKNIIIVFDGKKAPGIDISWEMYGDIKVIYSLYNSADEILKDLIKKDRSPRSNLLVSSDKEIQRFAKMFGMKTKTSEEFAKDITEAISISKEKPEKPENPTITKEEVEYWLKEFRKRRRKN